MSYTLIVKKEEKEFNTVTEAYHYYLKHYSTFGDWLYYLRVAHRLLSSVKDEQTMKSIFMHAFRCYVRLIENKERI